MNWATLIGFGSKAVGFLAPVKWYLIGALMAVVAYHFLQDHNLKQDLKEAIAATGVLGQQKEQLLHTDARNQKALTECLDANSWNALQSNEQERRAEAALADVRMMVAMNERDAEDVKRETDKLRNQDKVCRTVDEPLPAWILPDSLWAD